VYSGFAGWVFAGCHRTGIFPDEFPDDERAFMAPTPTELSTELFEYTLAHSGASDDVQER